MQLCFDHNASGPVHAAAWQAYVEGCQRVDNDPDPTLAARLLDQARQQVGALLGAAPHQVIFTSGGTEGDARALHGLLGLPAAVAAPLHAVTSCVEHAAVSQTLRLLARQHPQLEITHVAAEKNGVVSPARLQAALRPHTSLLSLTMACNETGVLQPIEEVAALCKVRGIALHSDAVQAVGRQVVNFARLRAAGLTALSFSGHKIGAVGGTGVLLWQKKVSTPPFATPEAAEHNLPGVLSLAAALQTCTPEAMACRQRHMAAQRDYFEADVMQHLSGCEIVGGTARRLANTSCIRFAGCDGDGLMMALDLKGLAVSTGSACSSGSIEASPILLGMGLTDEQAKQAVRISFGPTTAQAEVTKLVAAVVQGVQRARSCQNV